MKKTLPIFLTCFGLVLFTIIAARAGIHPVLQALGKVGLGGFLLVVGYQLLVDIGLGLAWKGSVPQIGTVRLIGARLARDAAATCLPFSQLGGIAIGVRATLAGRNPVSRDGTPLRWPEGVASNLVDITTEVLGQIAFVLLAVLCLVGHDGAARFIWPLSIGMVLLSLGIAAFIWTQLRGGTVLQRSAQFLGRHIAAGWSENLIDDTALFQERLESLWGRADRIALGAFSHFMCWIAGAGLTWLALSLLGAHTGFMSALAIEGVVCGVMSAGFLVPAALGVQEAAYVALGMMFGIDSEIALSLSLLRRGRDLMIGIPVLLYWQFVEVRRLRLQVSEPSING
ncbi:lysylphosphatidylglycerol synthase domain-containing protein [Neokomagataea anthophila]|uniref:Flippase-like domain-containing protein n=1 Tax=Neokomagataea anthophila TaxID=2826925 RepID=A0ABS5E7H0_9PROT|nr:lysylphosphatidylglycerol synthase domain-containing protein [Neokomagataea anthophila]MBR0559756.1 flippase-like domain-containing protein [Neokomagataea anthophila]